MSLASSLIVGAVTVGIVIAAALVVGFVLLVRRGRVDTTARSNALDDHAARARIALVRLDDEVASSSDELGFAVAQFGDEQSRSFAAAVAAAKAALAEAFALQQKLDDAAPDTAAQQRAWRDRILALCGFATTTLSSERREFDQLRTLERDAPRAIDDLTAELQSVESRLPDTDATLDRVKAQFAPAAVAPVASKPADARALLERARGILDEARGQADSSGASAISRAVAEADRHVRRADAALDEVHELEASLMRSQGRLTDLVAEATDALVDATAVRDSAPDPASRALVADAVSALTDSLARAATGARATHSDPDAAIADLESASARLDTALASVRTQHDRLTHARDALAGALLTARSQIETTSSYIGHRRGGVSADARTRLAEAERLLAIAEAEADPIVALDTARSSATYSRDADALARYDLLH